MRNGRKFLLIYLLLQVLKENNVRKEELRVRAVALKILGKIFQVHILTCLALIILIFMFLGKQGNNHYFHSVNPF